MNKVPHVLVAAVLTEIHLGIAMARSRGVVCGTPINIKIKPGVK